MQHKLQNANLAALLELPFVAYEQSYTTSNGTILNPVEEVRDLGVQVHHTLSWSLHIQNITKKANQAASWVLSVFRCRDHHTMLTVYKSLVRSHIWNIVVH